MYTTSTSTLCDYGMCYYRLYVYMGCGHSRLSETPVRYCKDARIKEDNELKSKADLCDSEETGSSVWSLPDNDESRKASDKAKIASSWPSRSTTREMNEKLVVPVIAPSTEDNSSSTRALQTNKQPKSVAKSTKSMFFMPLGPLQLLLPTFMKNSQLDAPKPPGTHPILEPCGESQVHPLHTRKLELSCPTCTHERLQRLRELDSLVQEVRPKPDGWQWRYQGAKEERANGMWGVW